MHVPREWLPDFQIGLFAQACRGTDAGSRLELSGGCLCGAFPPCSLRPDISRHSAPATDWRIVILPVASREGCECREVERARQPSQRPKNLKVRSQACCDQTGSYWVAGIRCGPTAVSLAKA